MVGISTSLCVLHTPLVDGVHVEVVLLATGLSMGSDGLQTVGVVHHGVLLTKRGVGSFGEEDLVDSEEDLLIIDE